MAVSGTNLSPEGLDETFVTECRKMYEKFPEPLTALMLNEPNIEPQELENIHIPVLITVREYDLIKKQETKTYESGRKKGAEETASALTNSEDASDNPDSKQESSVEDNVDDSYTLDLRVLEKNIRKVKSIGAKRTEEVMAIIEQWLKLE